MWVIGRPKLPAPKPCQTDQMRASQVNSTSSRSRGINAPEPPHGGTQERLSLTIPSLTHTVPTQGDGACFCMRPAMP